MDRTVIALQAIALCCLVLAGILGVVDSAQRGTGAAVAVTWLALVPVIAGLWAVRPRLIRAGHGVAVTTVSIVAATPVVVFGRLDFTIPVLLLVVAFAVVDVSLRAGAHAMIWIASVGLALHVGGAVGSGRALLSGVLDGLLNVVPVAVLMCFGIALGLSLRGFESERSADQRVIRRLHRASETEKELLLSDERARSARELHDGLGYKLTLVSMSLELADRLRSADAEQAWAEVRTARSTSSEALADMRMWVRALSPFRDAGARGLAALELIAESFRGTGVTVDVVGDEASDRVLTSDDETALVVYRGVQEGLTNALRHGAARRVRIDIETDDVRLELSLLSDIGAGRSNGISDGEPVLGFGLRGLDDRATARGGRLTARRIGDRFLLRLSIPLGAADGERESRAS
ncbi:sensor histidine kinase [Rathayibacter sp. AY1C1]|uniref:sensor histidine kinase n=1 Tax=Rathayibacter sp. AY1C1 TaxID=2080534 RepID=UPI0011B02AC7|nr:histidine kinase [Rathayibacter sp. AY1C1]